MPATLQKTIYTGTFIHTPTFGSLSVQEDLAVGVDERGVICFLEALFPPTHDDNVDHGAKGGETVDEGPGDEEEKRRRRVRARVNEVVDKHGWGDGGWRWVSGANDGAKGNGGRLEKRGRRKRKRRSWWFPGFVDTHIHASQHPNTGLFGTTTLLSWLTTYTYPLESSLHSPTRAHAVYTACVTTTLTHGTTTAAYFATAHAPSTNTLASICLQKGQRAFIGRVCMDSDLSPPYYRDESPDFAIRQTREVVEYIATIDPERSLLTPIITPRFAPSCSSTLLGRLGALAKDTGLPIQTHISETLSECALVKELFPYASSYADVYDGFGLLTYKTVLAHGIHLSAPERDLIRERKSCISHCPVSNTALSSGLCPVRELLDEGITVGLGTDVSGGYSSSMLVAAREASMVSRTLTALDAVDASRTEITTQTPLPPHTDPLPPIPPSQKTLSVPEVLYLATRGGATCLNLENTIGAFEIGMQWDAQLIELGSARFKDVDVGSAGFKDVDELGTAAVKNINMHRNETEQNETPATGEGEEEEEDDDDDDDNPIHLWGEETWEEKVAKWVFCGDERNTKAVYVRGVLVHERE